MASFMFGPLAVVMVGFVLSYIAFKLDETNSYLKWFFTFASLLLIASSTSVILGVANSLTMSVAQYQLLARTGWIIGTVFVISVFYLIWSLIRETVGSMIKTLR